MPGSFSILSKTQMHLLPGWGGCGPALPSGGKLVERWPQSCLQTLPEPGPEGQRGAPCRCQQAELADAWVTVYRNRHFKFWLKNEYPANCTCMTSYPASKVWCPNCFRNVLCVSEASERDAVATEAAMTSRKTQKSRQPHGKEPFLWAPHAFSLKVCQQRHLVREGSDVPLRVHGPGWVTDCVLCVRRILLTPSLPEAWGHPLPFPSKGNI